MHEYFAYDRRSRTSRPWALYAVLLVLPSMVGCQQPTERYHAELSRAHRALQAGHTGQASRALATAEELATQNELTRAIAHDLLAAELCLQEGDTVAALDISQQVAASTLPNSVDRARAQEITGKSALRHGEFDAAIEHFDAAGALYEADEDLVRIGDLILLARGLEAYAKGNPGSAQEAWGGISDDRLRSALEQTRRGLEVAVKY